LCHIFITKPVNHQLITTNNETQQGYNLDGSLSRSWAINMSSKNPIETKHQINKLFI